MTTEAHIPELIARGALFVINHSGGKDSQAMMIKLLGMGIPARQMVVVHADLGEVEWHGAKELAAKQAADAGVPFVVALAYFKDGSAKDFFSYTAPRFELKKGEVPPFPSKAQRWCTSELKRGPILREARKFAVENGFKLIVNCEGLRADESADRAKKSPFEVNKELSKAGREAYDWLPIHALTTADVFAMIRGAGQEPHPAYAAGNERLSCVFCIFGSKGDIARGAAARPELFAKFAELEERYGYTMHMSRKSLKDIVAEAAELAVAA